MIVDALRHSSQRHSNPARAGAGGALPAGVPYRPGDPSPARIVELDGVRGFAILLVVLWHYVAISIPADAGKPLLFVRQVLGNAWSGVDLFFVLSGFLITGILIDNRRSPAYFQAFYARRASRIFPLYAFFLFGFFLLRYVSLHFGIFTETLFASPLPIAPYFLYLQNIAMALGGTFGNEFLAVTWSLAIEEHFYLLLPLLVRRIHPRRLLLTILVLIGLSVGLRAALLQGTLAAFVLTPWRLDGLFLGAILAIVFRSRAALDVLRRHIGKIKMGCALLLGYFIFSSLTEDVGSLDHLFVFSLFFAGLVFLTLSNGGGILARVFRARWLVSIGQVSYGIYLFHQMVNGLVHDLWFKSSPSFGSLPTILATLFAALATYALAKATYQAFEKRFIEFGHQIRYSAAEPLPRPILRPQPERVFVDR